MVGDKLYLHDIQDKYLYNVKELFSRYSEMIEYTGDVRQSKVSERAEYRVVKED